MKMQSQTSISDTSLQIRLKEFATSKWDSLSVSQKELAKRLWGVLTYKWQWQIVLTSPFLVLWALDKTIPSVHKFDMALLASLPIPQWIESLIGLS